MITNKLIISMILLFLAAFIVYMDRDGYGWCIFGSVVIQCDIR